LRRFSAPRSAYRTSHRFQLFPAFRFHPALFRAPGLMPLPALPWNLRPQQFPVSRLRRIPYLQPKPKAVSTSQCRLLLCILPTDLAISEHSATSLTATQTATQLAPYVLLALFLLELSVEPSVGTRLTSNPYSDSTAGPIRCFCCLALANQTFQKLRLERFRTSHARVDGRLLLPRNASRQNGAESVTILWISHSFCGQGWKSGGRTAEERYSAA
jgi:hypothetical protein